MIRFVFEGGIFCTHHPCYGWIHTEYFFIGAIFWVTDVITTDSQGHQTVAWKGKIWNRWEHLPWLKSEAERINGLFEATQNDWLYKWKMVTQPKVVNWRNGAPGEQANIQ